MTILGTLKHLVGHDRYRLSDIVGLCRRFVAWQISPPETRCVMFQGHALPPRSMRFSGGRFSDDDYFVQSAVKEAERLKDLGMGPTSRVLEVGCGPGRIAIGLLYTSCRLSEYHGVDVHRRSIEWCRRFISRKHPSYHFSYIDVKNERYNPYGGEMTEEFSLPFAPESFDIIYLLALYTNLLENEARIYTREFRRLVAPGGRLFLTAFVEEGVPPVTVNPKSHPGVRGPMALVQYEKGLFCSILESGGWEIERFEYGTDLYGSSCFFLAPGTICAELVPPLRPGA